LFIIYPILVKRLVKFTQRWFDFLSYNSYIISKSLIQNKELKELALVDADFANLEWKVDEIGVRLNELERNHGTTSDSSIQP